MAASSAGEVIMAVQLSGGTLEYRLRRSPRSRRLRVTLDPARGVMVSVPPATRRGWARPEALVESFLRDREPWLRRHLARQASQRSALAARGGLRDGALIRYRGELHRLRIEEATARQRALRSAVSREGGPEGDELVVTLAARDRRPVAIVLRDWLGDRAAVAINREVARHAPPLDVEPVRISVRDPRSRWGSASKEGRLSFSWRLVLAPPEALETVVIHELAHLRVFGHGPSFWALVASRRPDHLAWRRWLREHSIELHGALDDVA